MKFDTEKELASARAKAVKMKKAGAKMKQILVETGLNHSQAESAIMEASFTDEDRKWFEKLAADTPGRCVAARKANKSWGWIAVMAGVPESQVRKHWANATGLKSQGQRIGRGGRFYYGDGGRPLYENELKPTGTDIKVGSDRETAILQSRLQRMVGLEMDELKNLGKDYGVTFRKGDTKTKYAQRIIAAATAKKAPAATAATAPATAA